MRIRLLFTLLALAFTLSTPSKANPWKGTIPEFAQDAQDWANLLKALEENQLPYGALAASSRILMFFQDLPSKEAAYRSIISLIDQGYPFSTRSFFVSGDIEPSEGANFANSYNFYKGLIAKERGLDQWAEHYFGSVDKENFPKFLFHSALEAYARKDLDAAEKGLRKVLGMSLEKDQTALAQKVARTLARIYFETERYDKSLDIYDSFLLKLNPINPNDWLEAAWNLYYLKRYDRALGYVYNLESRSTGDLVNLEKYVIRALIYQGVCDTKRMDSLLKTFEHDFGKTIHAIKSGETLAHLPDLKTIFFAGNADFYHAETSLKELESELKDIKRIPSGLAELAQYLYRSEITMFKRKANSYTEQALTQSAMHLVQLSENLRFLKFDVSRERYNPETVFQTSEEKPKSSARDAQEAGLEIHWLQLGDFWRDERPDYRGILKNRCAKE